MDYPAQVKLILNFLEKWPVVLTEKHDELELARRINYENGN
jgi:hypothetical protein